MEMFMEATQGGLGDRPPGVLPGWPTVQFPVVCFLFQDSQTLLPLGTLLPLPIIQHKPYFTAAATFRSISCKVSLPHSFCIARSNSLSKRAFVS